MKENRKLADTYRFNGPPFLHALSIQSVKIADVELRIKDVEAKLADCKEPDDAKGNQRWLPRFEKELAKKRKGLAPKQRERHDRRREEEDITNGYYFLPKKFSTPFGAR